MMYVVVDGADAACANGRSRRRGRKIGQDQVVGEADYHERNLGPPWQERTCGSQAHWQVEFDILDN